MKDTNIAARLQSFFALLIVLLLPWLICAQNQEFTATSPPDSYWDGAKTYYTENGKLEVDFSLTDSRFDKVESVSLVNMTTSQSAVFPVVAGRIVGELFLLEGVNLITVETDKKKSRFQKRIRVFYNPYQAGSGGITSSGSTSSNGTCDIRLRGTYQFSPQVGSRDLIISRYNKSDFPIQFLLTCCSDASLTVSVEDPRSQAIALTSLGNNLYSFNAQLVDYQNIFTIRATCNGENIAQRTVVVRVDQEIATRLDTAVIFAVSDHSKDARRAGWTDLKYSVEDAEALKWTLENKFGFKTAIVLNPTWEQMNETMVQLQYKQWGRLDQLLVFFTGHGHRASDGTGYLIPSNAGESVKTYYKMEDLRSQIDRIGCNNIMLGIDACFASTFLERGGQDIPLRKSNDIHGLLSSDLPFRYFIGSAPANQKVRENLYVKESQAADEKYRYRRKKFKVSQFMMAFLESIEECEAEANGRPIPIWEVGRKVEELYRPQKRKKGEKVYARATRFGSQNDKGFHFIGKNFLLQ